MDNMYIIGLRRALVVGAAILGITGAVSSPAAPLVARAATVTVTNTNDSGPGSLRQAILDAAPGDTITFAPSVTGPIILTTGELLITKPLEIDGPASGRQVIDGNQTSRVFEIGTGATVTLANLQVQNGVGTPGAGPGAASGQGGGIYSAGGLTLANSAVVSNTATGTAGLAGGSGGDAAGGGVYATDTLILTGATVVSSNAAVGGAGANASFGIVPPPSAAGNGGAARGSGIYAAGALTLAGTTVVLSNTATGGAGGNGSIVLPGPAGSGGAAQGGGVYVTGGATVDTGSSVTGNRALGGAAGGGSVGLSASGGAGAGGGLYNASGALAVTSATISANTASSGAGSGFGFPGNIGGVGGGIYSLGALTLSGATVSANTTSGGFFFFGNSGGGGIFAGAGATLADSTISGNSATSGVGGGLYATGAAVSVTTGSLVSNTAISGGGAYVTGALTVADSTLMRNSASAGVGGGLVASADATITRSPVLSNTASGPGGGLFAGSGLLLGANTRADPAAASGLAATDATLASTTHVQGGTTAVSARIALRAGTLTVTDSPIAGNTAGSNGGGIYATGGATLTRSPVLSNTAAGGANNGGGIFAVGGPVSLVSSPVLSNTASGSGGGLYASSPLTVTASVVGSNTAQVNGGGLVASGPTTLSQDAVVSNTVGVDGGGILATAGLTLTNVTLSANTAITQGGAISTTGALSAMAATVAGNSAGTGGGIASATGVTATFGASILAGNTATNGPDCAGALVSGGYLVLGTFGGCTYTPGPGDIIGQDARLGPLADNGGSTLTRALLPGSPAIGIVPPASGLCPPTDQRGVPRPGAGKSACDSGAYESGVVAPDTATATASDTATNTATPTATATATAIPTTTNTATATATNSSTATAAATATATATATPTPANVNNGPTTLYFAEGYTGLRRTNGKATYHDTLSILNANPFPAAVTITYLVQGAAVPTVVTRAISPRTTLRESVEGDIGADRIAAAVVSSPSRITAQRTIERVGADGRLLDGNSSLGNPNLGESFYFAEGYTGGSFQEYLTLANPGNQAAHVKVVFAPQAASSDAGSAPAPNPSETIVVPAHGRSTNNINRDTIGLSNKAVGLIVSSNQPIMAERVLYFGSGNGSGKYGSTAKAGIQTVASQYLFAYGSAGGHGLAQQAGDQSFVTILNPGLSPLSETVQAQFFNASGRKIGSTAVAIAPGTRQTIKANAAVANTAAVYSTVLTAASPFVAEKPQYYGGDPSSGNHAGIAPSGAPAGVTSASFPDLGLTDPVSGAGQQQTLFLYNPTSRPVTVTGTYYGSAGSINRDYPIPARQILTVNVNADAASLPAGALAGAFVVSSHGSTDAFVATLVTNSSDGRSYTGTQGAVPVQ